MISAALCENFKFLVEVLNAESQRTQSSFSSTSSALSAPLRLNSLIGIFKINCAVSVINWKNSDIARSTLGEITMCQ